MCSFRANFVLPFTCYEIPQNRPKSPKMSHLECTSIKIMFYLVNTHKFQLSLFRIPLLTITEGNASPHFLFHCLHSSIMNICNIPFFGILLYMSIRNSKMHNFVTFYRYLLPILIKMPTFAPYFANYTLSASPCVCM